MAVIELKEKQFEFLRKKDFYKKLLISRVRREIAQEIFQ